MEIGEGGWELHDLQTIKYTIYKYEGAIWILQSCKAKFESVTWFDEF